ncbi:sugar phosphate isomerase/epimerase family protein [Microbacterium sp. A93]|uniref:sugar phosphate isomerase/epimerase family protein n=1 Tax=Microbacterium sp. A93 TaxID=3450716 RepID=UPI003F42F0B9
MPTATGRLLGVAQLSLLSAAPPRLVQLAADAGFDFVGVRVRPVTAAEVPFDVQPGSPMLVETLSRMADTGVGVRDIEFLLLDGTDQRDAWMRMFEAGQALGAESLTVACGDPDLARARDTLAQMAEDGQPYGISPGLEAISYQSVRSIPVADEIAVHAGCDLVVDTLHVGRFGATAAELSAAASRAPMVQLCDAPAERPATRDALVAESRSARLAPGEGGLDLLGVVAALEAGLATTPRAGTQLPVSLEVPNDEAVARLGEAGWLEHLHSCALRLLDQQATRAPSADPDAATAATPSETTAAARTR